MDYRTIVAYVFGIVLLYITVWILYKPFKVLVKLLLNSTLGGMALLALNFLGGWMGLNIGINLYTSIIVGICGMPGMALMLILQRVF